MLTVWFRDCDGQQRIVRVGHLHNDVGHGRVDVKRKMFPSAAGVEDSNLNKRRAKTKQIRYDNRPLQGGEMYLAVDRFSSRMGSYCVVRAVVARPRRRHAL